MLSLLAVLAHGMTLEQQLEDAQVFRDAAAQHPARTLYSSEEELAQAWTELIAQLDEPRDPWSFWGLIAPYAARIGCGHSGVDAGPTMVQRRPLNTVPFPLDLVVVDGELAVDPRGGEPWGRVVSIQGVEAATLLPKLRAMTSSDALSTPFQDHQIDAFAWYLVPAVVGPAERYSVEIVRDGENETLDVGWEDHRPLVWGGPPADKRVERVPVGDGFVVRASFEEFQGRGKMRRKVIKPIHRAVKQGAKGVIVDLRRNGGGDWTAAADLLAHWQDAPWPTYDARIITRALAEERGWNPERTLWTLRDDGLVDMGYGDMAEWPPATPHLDVPLVVLTGGLTFSTAADVAAFVRRDELGTLVGSPTGGSGRVQTSQASIDGRLPNSDLPYSIALHRSDLADPTGSLGPGDVVHPHVEVEPSLEDLAAGRDPVMDAALALFD